MELCANTSYLRKHMRAIDDAERRRDEIDRRTSALMETDYSIPEIVGDVFPEFNAAAIEAIGVLMCNINAEIEAQRPAVADRLRVQLSRLIEGMTDNYRAKLAKAKAEEEINNAICQRCFDAGCLACREAA
ncbi:hypothetical protein ACLIIZ_03230 [Azonexus caeni]|uniref:hypothetical protein n=1 Tax=Azonexus caeni TaxID=266126 RepID=UPI003A86CD05